MKKTIGSWILIIAICAAGGGFVSLAGCGSNVSEPTGSVEPIDEEDEESGESEEESEAINEGGLDTGDE